MLQVFREVAKWLKGDRDAERTNGIALGRSGNEPRSLHTIVASREQIASDLGKLSLFARTCAVERSRNTGALPQDTILCESNTLIDAAKQVDCLLETKKVPGVRYTLRSGESEVRLAGTEQCYYKIKNPFAKLHLKKHPPKYVIFEHVVHNILFPECRLEFLGVAEDNHEARLVYRQHAVPSVTRPTDEQVSKELQGRGLRIDGRYSFGNEKVFVTDVGQDSDNVLVDSQGKLCFIDPIIGFKEPLQKTFDKVLGSEDTIFDCVVDEVLESMTHTPVQNKGVAAKAFRSHG